MCVCVRVGREKKKKWEKEGGLDSLSHLEVCGCVIGCPGSASVCSSLHYNVWTGHVPVTSVGCQFSEPNRRLANNYDLGHCGLLPQGPSTPDQPPAHTWLCIIKDDNYQSTYACLSVQLYIPPFVRVLLNFGRNVMRSLNSEQERFFLCGSLKLIPLNSSHCFKVTRRALLALIYSSSSFFFLV